MSRHILPVLLFSAALNGCVEPGENLEGPAPTHQHDHSAHHSTMPDQSKPTMPLFNNLGSHQHKISTRNKSAQAYFNQGYRLLFNFNHAAAIASFEAALEQDPNCAMCWWGIAFAHGPNINMPMLPDAQTPALNAINQAKSLASNASPAERDYIETLSARYSAQPGAERAALDKAFALAAASLAKKYPKDLDAQVLYAEALMDTSPWDYWQTDRRSPKAGIEPLIPTLESVFMRAPKHPGAIHLYIHAVEASENPKRAERYADTLGSLLPGAGHLVHMPTHIYNRVGRYDDGVKWNQKAARADEVYFEKTQDRGMYAAMYYVHNLHFVWTAATNDGRKALANEYAQRVAQSLDPGMVKNFPSAQIFVPTKLYAALRFGEWNNVLSAPAPDPSLHFAVAIWHYARARAYASSGKLSEAEAESALIAASFSEADGKHFLDFGVPGQLLVRIASHVSRAEIALAKKDTLGAVKELREAVKAQDQLPYTEPPWWDFPVRQYLGAALLKSDRAQEAAEVYRRDLKEWPQNGWSLFGLAQALEKMGHQREASSVRNQFKRAWKRADVKLTESRF